MNWYERARTRVRPEAIAYSGIVGLGINALSFLQVPAAYTVYEMNRGSHEGLGPMAIAVLGLVSIVSGVVEVAALKKRKMSSNIATNILQVGVSNPVIAVALSTAFSIASGFAQDPVNWAAIGASLATQNPDLVYANQIARAAVFGSLTIGANIALLTNQSEALSHAIRKVKERVKKRAPRRKIAD